MPFIGRYESYSAQDIYDQYIKDWNEWPAATGCAVQIRQDANGVTDRGVYDPRVDIPGQPGSDQTLWYVANDMSNLAHDSWQARRRSGSKCGGRSGDTSVPVLSASPIFASTLLINKSGAPDRHDVPRAVVRPDLGDAGDDFAGCDTSGASGTSTTAASMRPIGVAVPAGGFTSSRARSFREPPATLPSSS